MIKSNSALLGVQCTSNDVASRPLAAILRSGSHSSIEEIIIKSVGSIWKCTDVDSSLCILFDL